ncbi:MAG: hypothetical protein ACHQKY_08360 [Terriglobia bacterium]
MESGLKRRSAAIDLAVAVAFFLAASACWPVLDPILRNGRGLGMVFALATYQFTCEGLALLLIMAIRHERFSDYGFVARNIGKSIALACVLAAVYDLGLSWHVGALMWIPLRRQPAIRMSLAAGFPLSVVGFAITVASWGFFESFFGVFFATKLNLALGQTGRGLFSPGTLGFALFNGLIHLAVGQGVQGFVASFASGYAIAVIPAVTGNAWGSTIVQTLTDAVGKL